MKASAAPSVSIVVPVAGRRQHLERLLAGVRVQTRPPIEVVIVDMDGSLGGGPPVDAVAGGVRTRVLRTGAAVGGLPLSRARNAGALAADGHLLVFLDVDCIPGRRCVADHVDGALRWDGALLAGTVRYLRRGWEDPFDTVPGVHDERALEQRSEASPIRPIPPEDRRATQDEYDLFWSLNFACTTSTFERIGGFDEDYSGYGAEDTDFGRTARRRDVPLVWSAGALAFHQWHEPSHRDPAMLASMVANARRFHRRWGDWPMRGWLADLASNGEVDWDPDGDDLALTAPVRR